VNPAGGLARRAWLKNQLRIKYPDAALVFLDSGNYSDNPTPEGEAKTVALLEGMGKLGYAAAGVAERDLAFGYDDFVKKARDVSFPFVSTNFVRKGTTEPVFKPYVVVEAKRGGGKPPLRVGVMSVVRFNPSFMKAGPSGSNVAIAPPAEAVRRWVEEVRKNSDVVVLLSALSNYDTHDLARAVPGIDFVFGAYGGAYSVIDEAEGNTRIVFTGNQGKRVGESRVFLDGSKRILSNENYLYFLTGRFPDDPEMLRWTQGVLAKMRPAVPGGPAAAPAVGRGSGS